MESETAYRSVNTGMVKTDLPIGFDQFTTQCVANLEWTHIRLIPQLAEQMAKGREKDEEIKRQLKRVGFEIGDI